MGTLHLFVLITYFKFSFFFCIYNFCSCLLISSPSGVFFKSSFKKGRFMWNSVFNYLKFSSVTQSCPTLCIPTDCSRPGFPVLHHLPELAQTHVHWVGDVIQPFHPLSSPSPPTFNLSHHQDLFQGVSSSHHVAKVLEFQLQHQPF